MILSQQMRPDMAGQQISLTFGGRPISSTNKATTIFMLESILFSVS